MEMGQLALSIAMTGRARLLFSSFLKFIVLAVPAL